MEGSYVLAARLSDGLRGAGDHRRAEPQWPLEPGRRAAGAHRGGPAGGGGLRQRDAAARHRYPRAGEAAVRSEEHTSELQSLMRISYAVCCLKKKKTYKTHKKRT